MADTADTSVDTASVPPTPDSILRAERRARSRRALQGALLAVAVIASLWFTGMLDGTRIAQGVPAIGTLLSEMLPPDFTRWRDWMKPLADTVAMSVAGTALAIAMSLPLALLAAPNTSPNGFIRYVARSILNLMRAIPELIMGIVFVAAVGFGMLPGVLALGLHSIGMVGKFFAEAIEHAHQAPIEAAEATGATPLQVIRHAVLPQVLPQFADVTMYRWEYNFRASTVMGMVGAGGIGTELIGSLRILDYAQVGAILIIILAAVAVVDGLSNWLRRRLT
jgi:phosphonate transport system permease protein